MTRVPGPTPEPPLGDSDEMPLGEHRGARMEDVPAAYLLWCADQPFAAEPRWRRVVEYVGRNRDVLELEVEADAPSDEDAAGA